MVWRDRVCLVETESYTGTQWFGRIEYAWLRLRVILHGIGGISLIWASVGFFFHEPFWEPPKDFDEPSSHFQAILANTEPHNDKLSRGKLF